MQARHIPNIISILRILLVPFVLWQLWQEHYAMALILFAVAGASDGIDGFLARHFNWTSRLGSILDPLADKLLQASVYVLLGWLTLLPWWLAVAVVGRDLVIIIGATTYHSLIGDFEMKPTLLSKLNTILQIALVLVVISSAAGLLALPAWLLWALIYIVTFTTVASGVHYVLTWTRNYLQFRQQRQDES
jgi:cardiolipin synthase